MSWLLREKPDGRRTAGYLVYLLAGAGATGALFLLHHHAGGGGSAPRRRPPAKASNIASITQPAAIMAPVDVAAGPDASDARSYRLGQPSPARPSPSAAGESAGPKSFNAIDAALAAAAPAAPSPAEDAGKPRPLDDGGTVSPYAELPPALPEARSQGSNSSAEGIRSPALVTQLMGYRDPTADSPALGPGRAVPGPAAASEYFAPRGTLIYAYLLTTVDTGNPTAVIQFSAARNLYFNRRCQLPFGTRFLGRLAGHAARDRINLTVDTILYPDGLELPVSASAVEADDAGMNIRPGVGAYYFPPPPWVQLAPYFSDFFTGAMGLLASRAQSSLTVGVGGVSVQTAGTGDVRAPLYQASAQAMQDLTLARLKELEQRYASYYLVPAGTACWLQLDADLDLAAAHAERRIIRLHAPPALPLSAAAAPASDVSN